MELSSINSAESPLPPPLLFLRPALARASGLTLALLERPGLWALLDSCCCSEENEDARRAFRWK